MLYNIVLAIMLSVICPDVHKPSLSVLSNSISLRFVLLISQIRFFVYNAACCHFNLPYSYNFNYKLLIIIGLATICWFCFVTFHKSGLIFVPRRASRANSRHVVVVVFVL